MSTGTVVIAVDPREPDPAVLRRAGEFIRAGKLVAFPTETVYGVGTDALNAEAVARIFEAKGRAVHDPIIVHIASLSSLYKLTSAVPPEVAGLAARFWPGPLTLVLPRGAAVPLNVTAGLDTVAVRMPSHPVAVGVVREAGTPVAAPSANLFTRPSATLAGHVISDLSGRVDMILDAGPATYGVESTVLDLTSRPPRILRPGALTLEQLREVLPYVQAQPEPQPHAEGGMAAPGMMLKHYSPRAEMMVFDGEDRERVLEAIAAAIEHAALDGRSAGLLLADEDLAALSPRLQQYQVSAVALGPSNDLAAQARTLFAGIRELDRGGVDVIATRLPPGGGLGLALRDRLRRAASGRVIVVE